MFKEMYPLNVTTTATGRAGYDSFDCAQAVALIAFLGLLSNFQDIIEVFTTRLNGRRRRRRRSVLDKLSHLIPSDPWEKLQPAIDLVNWASDKQSEVDELGDAQMDDVANDVAGDDVREKKESNKKDLTPFVNDIAMSGPQIALWIVDAADGRISGEEARAGVCQTIHMMEGNHGFIGSVFGNLLTQTVVKAMASHSPSEKFLQAAALHDNPNPCFGVKSISAFPQTA